MNGATGDEVAQRREVAGRRPGRRRAGRRRRRRRCSATCTARARWCRGRRRGRGARGGLGSTTVPPPARHERAFQWAAPCISGGAGRVRGAGPGRRRPPPPSRRGARHAEGAGEEVGLPPQHALGPPGGAAGVDDVEVVGRRGGRGRRGRRRPGRPRRRWLRRAAGVPLPSSTTSSDVEACGRRGRRRPRRASGRSGRGTIAAGARAVGDEVGDLLGGVAVVDVGRPDPGQVAAEHPLEVLGAVASGRAGRGPGRPPTGPAAVGRRVGAQAAAREHRGQPPAPVDQLARRCAGAARATRSPRGRARRRRPPRWTPPTFSASAPPAAMRRAGRPATADDGDLVHHVADLDGLGDVDAVGHVAEQVVERL